MNAKVDPTSFSPSLLLLRWQNQENAYSNHDGKVHMSNLQLKHMHVCIEMFFFLAVPHVRIQGSPDIHVNQVKKSKFIFMTLFGKLTLFLLFTQGSLINLTCIISYSPEPPAFIFWYRGNEVQPERFLSPFFPVKVKPLPPTSHVTLRYHIY